MKVCYFILILFLISSCQTDISLYVSTSGDDSSSGTIEMPFATLQKALDVSRLEKSKNITIYFREGTYYLEKAVVFTHEDSRADNASLTITAYNSEKVIISGAKKLPALRWEGYRNGIKKATVPKGFIFDQLFVNGQLQQIGRAHV